MTLTFHALPRAVAIAAAALAFVAIGAAQAPQPPPQTPQQPTNITTSIIGGPGEPARFALPSFIALSSDAETIAVTKTIGDVLWDDLTFEREFALMPRDVIQTVPAAKSFEDVPLDRWRELNADGLIVGTVQKRGGQVHVEVRLINIQTSQQVFGQQYDGSPGSARLYAHTIADELHKQQRALRGVARTKLTFNSDRDGERMRGTIENRSVKEIYISDYDGESPRRVTTSRSLNITPTWSPDARSIAYTSYQRGVPNIFISNIYVGTREDLTKEVNQNFLPSWSPDGTRICFMSMRDGNPELYVANRDGSNVRRLTNHQANDVAPTWSPSGTQIAFTSDRSGTPQIYLISADGLGGVLKLTSESYADRPTWSPPPFNEIAFASRTGPGFDIKVIDVATRQVKQLTFGEGTNESPAYAPNGRHLAFASTRAGKNQIFTMARDGKDVRQVTRTGNNYQPDWSK